MTALLITFAAWLVFAPALALVLGAVLHARELQVPDAAERVVLTASAHRSVAVTTDSPATPPVGSQTTKVVEDSWSRAS